MARGLADAHPVADGESTVSDPLRVFPSIPKTGPAIRQALLSRKRGLPDGGTIPRIEASIERVEPDPARVEAYRRICGFPDSPALPPTYPHILGSPLHLYLAAAPEFPLPALGVVHVGNSITQHRPIGVDEVLSVACHVEGHRDVELGVEFDAQTIVRSGDEVVWESSSAVLSRSKKRRPGGKQRRTVHEERERSRSALVRLPEELGRRYGKVSGDFNPIHYHKLSAKLFGFDRAIIHGMWSLARSLAELDDDLPVDGAMVIDAAFKRPVFLPSTVLMSSRREAHGIAYAVRSHDGRKPHLVGEVRAL